MGRTRVWVLLGIFLGSILLLVALGCSGVSSGGSSSSPTPGGSGSSGGGGGSGSGGSGGGGGSGSGGGGGGGGTGGGGNASSVSKFIYGSPGFESGSIQAGSINSSDGAVSPVAGSPFSENMGESNLLQVTADSQGRFIYVLNVAAFGAGQQIGSAGICGFAVNQQTGALTLVPGSPLIFSQSNDNFMAEDVSGHFLVEPNGVVNSGNSTGFDVYSIDQKSGALTKTSSTSNAPPVGRFTVSSPVSPLVFNAGNGLVAAFSIAENTGQLTIVSGTPTSTSGSAGPMAVSADGKFLYVANQTEGTLSVFAIASTGMLTPVSGSPFTIDNGAQYLTLTPDGKFLYIASLTQAGDQTVKGYAVNPSAGKFAPIAGAVVNNVTSVTVDLSGKFAYISSVGNLVTYSIDASTGALTQMSNTNAPSSDNPTDMVTVP